MGFQVEVFADFAQIYQWASQKEQNVEKIRPKPIIFDNGNLLTLYKFKLN